MQEIDSHYTMEKKELLFPYYKSNKIVYGYMAYFIGDDSE